MLNKNRSNVDEIQLKFNWQSVVTLTNILTTFCLSTIAWVFFRAKTITDAFLYLQKLFTNGDFTSQYLKNERYNYELIVMVMLFVFVEWNNRDKVEPISGKYNTLKLALALLAILAFGTYSDYKELLKNKAIDAVLIATPFNTHFEIAMAAVHAGKHVYCEKTLAKGIQEVEALVDKVSKSSVIFQTGHQYHSSRLYKHVVELIKSDVIGNVVSFECQWYRQGNWRREVPEPQYERAVNWRMYKEYSGGMTAELSSHQIDFVNWVLGENPKKIMGTGGVDFWKDGRETYDNTHLLFEYPSGVKAKFNCLTSNIPGGYQIKVIGTKGTITMSATKAWIHHYKKPEMKALTEVDGVSGATKTSEYNPEKGMSINIEHLEPTKQALIDFRDSILENKQPISNVFTGANTAKAVQMSLDAMYKDEIQYWKAN